MCPNSISYAILACNEVKEIDLLLSKIVKYKGEDDEIVIVLDSDSVTNDIVEVITKYDDVLIYWHSLNKDFSSQKNFLDMHCSKDWIFNIDADEYPTDELLLNIKELISLNPVIEVYSVPRINTVDNITEDDIRKWGWRHEKIENDNLIDKIFTSLYVKGELNILYNNGYIIRTNNKHEPLENIEYYQPVVNFPDYQNRIYKNSPFITWRGNVHEQLIGYKSISNLPPIYEWCLIHKKDISRQRKQNQFYDQI